MNRREAIEGIGLLTLMPAWAHAQQATLEKVVLRTDFPPVAIHAGLFLAQEKGWWKDAGIDIEIQDGRGSTNTIAMRNIFRARRRQSEFSTAA